MQQLVYGSLVSSATADIHDGMVERYSDVAEINNNEIFFKQKGAGISFFCQRRGFALEDPEKIICDHKRIFGN